MGNWAWNPQTARRVNGFADPIDREPGMRDSDGYTRPEWRGRAILPPDLRTGADDPDNPHAHPENFGAARMWAHYFDGWRDEARCARVDTAVRDGACVALGCVSGTYTVEQILLQVYGRRLRDQPREPEIRQ